MYNIIICYINQAGHNCKKIIKNIESFEEAVERMLDIKMSEIYFAATFEII